MTALERISRDRRRGGAVRWISCGALVLTAHVIALAALRPDLEDAADDAGSPVAFIELAPMAVAPPTPPSDLAPGPVQSDSEANESEKQAPPPPPVEQPTAEPTNPPPVEAPQNQTAEEPLAPPSPTPVERPTPVDTPPPPPIAAQPDPPSDVSIPSAPPSAAEVAPEAAGPQTGRVKPAAAQRTERWQLSLVAHIERFKRYPRAARSRFGVVRLAFTIDRQGRLKEVRVVSGSGSPILDEEAIATIRRAAPFPTPPASASDDELSFVLPIRYAPATQR